MHSPQRKKSPSRLWLSLYFYQLPLDRLQTASLQTTSLKARSLKTIAKQQDASVAIIEKQRIVFSNNAAQAEGIIPAMRVATAYALNPNVQLIEREPHKEQECLAQLAAWCYQFTPTVAVYKHFSVVLEIGGSLQLFKGLMPLLTHIKTGLAEQGFVCAQGLAHTQETAWMLSQYRADYPDEPLLPAAFMAGFQDHHPLSHNHLPGPQDWLSIIQRLPISYLDIDPKQQLKLSNVGLRCIGDVLALPRSELGKRLGKPLLNLLTEIQGDAPQPTQDFLPESIFDSYWDFNQGVSQISELEKPAEQLIERLCGFIRQHHVATAALTWHFYYFKHAADSLTIHLAPSNNSARSFLQLSLLKFNHYTLKAPLESLRLCCDQLTPIENANTELFPELSLPSQQLQDYRHLLDKLLNRLGEHSLVTLALADEHLPEHQQHTTVINPLTIDSITFNATPSPISSDDYLPLWLTQAPTPISPPINSTQLVSDSSSDSSSNPETIASSTSSPLRIVYGPKRIDSHWWQQRQQRDYFIARHKNGSYCWVFQDTQNQRWFLQGFYG